MEYTREYWKPRIATNPNRFRKLNETTDYVELINEPEAISQSGTAITADRLNNIEAGIEGAVASLGGKAPTSHASSATTHGVSSEANYGHAKASTVAGSPNGTASKGTTPTDRKSVV